MSSVTIAQANSTRFEPGRRRQAGIDLRRRTVADRDHTRFDDRGLTSRDLVGRASELGIIRSMLDDVAHGGAAMVLSGGRGIGKTELLDAAESAASSRGMRVARAGGAEFEADIDFAGLHQLLLPLFAEISELPGRAGRALDTALGLVQGRTPDRLVVLNAVLCLLRHAALEAPVVLIVDDLHFFDRASTEALGFVARRLAGSRIGLLGAMRVGSDNLLERVGLPELKLRAEFRATGQTRHRSHGGGVAPLTPRELGVAELAATGLTNKEIGRRMYLSPRTVSAHLYRIFPKLGITSRAALRDALGALPASTPPHPCRVVSE